MADEEDVPIRVDHRHDEGNLVLYRATNPV